MAMDSSITNAHDRSTRLRVPGLVAQAGLVPLLAALSLHVVSLVVSLIRNSRLRQGVAPANLGLDFGPSLSNAANATVGLGILIAAGTFLAWFSGSYRQLETSQGTRYSSRWALLSWFVPGLNAIRPVEIMAELAESNRSSETSSSSNGILGAWWGLWILGEAIVIGLRFFVPTDNDQWAQWFRIAIGADVALIVSLLCGIVLIGRAD